MDACKVLSWRRQIETSVILTSSLPNADGDDNEDGNEDQPFGFFALTRHLASFAISTT